MPNLVSRFKRLAVAIPMAGSGMAKRIIRGGAWSLAGEAGARGLTLLGAVVVARWLGVEAFGAFGIVQSTAAMLITFALFGMGYTSTRHIAAFRTSSPERIQGVTSVVLHISGLTGLIAAVAMFLLAPILAERLLRDPSVTPLLRLMSPMILFSALSGAMNGTALGFEAFRGLAKVSWVASASSFALLLVGASAADLPGAVVGMVIGEAVRCLLLTRLAGRVLRTEGFMLISNFDRSEAHILWSFSLPIVLASALNEPVLWACQAIIMRAGGGLQEVGPYAAARKWMTLVVIVPMAFSAAFGPVLASMQSTDDVVDFNRLTRNLALLQAATVIVPAAIVGALSTTAMSVFGDTFEGGSQVIVLMMLVSPFFVLKHLYWQAITSRGHAWSALVIAALWSTVLISVTFWRRAEGARALAEASLIAHFTAFIVSAAFLHYQSRAKPVESIRALRN